MGAHDFGIEAGFVLDDRHQENRVKTVFVGLGKDGVGDSRRINAPLASQLTLGRGLDEGADRGHLLAGADHAGGVMGAQELMGVGQADRAFFEVCRRFGVTGETGRIAKGETG